MNCNESYVWVHFQCGDYMYVLKLTKWSIVSHEMLMVSHHVKKFHVFCRVKVHFCIHSSLPLAVSCHLNTVHIIPSCFL